MRTVRALYRLEADGAWIGTSPEVPGYVAYGDTYQEARDRMQEGLPWFAEDDLLIAHIVSPDQVSDTAGAKVSFGISRAPTPSYAVLPLDRKP